MTRYNNTITAGNWVDSGDYYYDFTGAGDTPDSMRDNSWTVTEKYLQLPGDVVLNKGGKVVTTIAKSEFARWIR